MRKILAGILLLTACGSDPYTWGDMSEDVADAYCKGLVMCGFEVDYPVCSEHTRFHLCETDHTCNVSLPDEAQDVVEACLAKMVTLDPASEDCYLLAFWGQVPEECAAVWDYRPEPEE
jgi:hypothetical protein